MYFQALFNKSYCLFHQVLQYCGNQQQSISLIKEYRTKCFFLSFSDKPCSILDFKFGVVQIYINEDTYVTKVN